MGPCSPTITNNRMNTTEPIGTFSCQPTQQLARAVYMTKPKRPGPFDDAEVIHTYSREDAIRDGVLVDVSPIAEEAGFKLPVAHTAALWARLEPSDRDQQLGQSIQGRLWDVLFVLRFMVVSCGPAPK